MKTGKIFTAGQKDFAEPRVSERGTGIPEKCESARLRKVSRGFVKSDMPICGQSIVPSYLNGLKQEIGRYYEYSQ